MAADRTVEQARLRIELRESSSLRLAEDNRDDGEDREKGRDGFQADECAEVHVVSFPSFEAFVVFTQRPENQTARKGKEGGGPEAGAGPAESQRA